MRARAGSEGRGGQIGLVVTCPQVLGWHMFREPDTVTRDNELVPVLMHAFSINLKQDRLAVTHGDRQHGLLVSGHMDVMAFALD